MPAATRPGDPIVAISVLLTEPLAQAHLELVDVEVEAIGTPQAVVRVLVEHLDAHPRGPRIDLDGVAEATRIVDEVLEANDPISSAFTLEVSSPGLERPLRTPAHFVRFVDAEITVKTVPGTAGERRVQGRLESADADSAGSIVVAGREVSYASIERARTVFRWGEEAPPTADGQPRKKGALPKGARPIHPKLLAKAAVSAHTSTPAEANHDALASSTHGASHAQSRSNIEVIS